MIKGKLEINKFFHFDYRTMADAARPMPIIKEVFDLANPDVVRQFEVVVKEILDNDDGEIALLGARLFEEILLPQASEIRQNFPAIYEEHQKFLHQLKFVNLENYPLNEIVGLIREYFLDVLRTKLPIIQKFQRVLDANRDIYLGGRVAEALANAMQQCRQKISSSDLVNIQGKIDPPTLGNLLTDYIQFSISRGEGRTGSLERVEYFKISANASKLTADQQKILLRVFRIYDWLRFGGEADPEEMFVKPLDFEAGNDFSNTQRFILSRDDQLKVLRSDLPVGNLPTAPQPLKGSLGPMLNASGIGPLKVDSVKAAAIPPVPKLFPNEIKIPQASGLSFGNRQGQSIKYKSPVPPATGQTGIMNQGKGKQEKQPLIPNPSNFAKATSDTSSLTKKPVPPVAPKPGVNIDQKLTELKKKAEKNKVN